MSQPEPIDCHEAAARLYEFLDGELTPALEAAIRKHLAVCAGCFGLYDFERAYLRFLVARTRAIGAPAHVRRRIFDELFGSDGVERE